MGNRELCFKWNVILRRIMLLQSTRVKEGRSKLTEDCSKVWFASRFAEKSGRKMSVFVGATTGVGGRGRCIGGWSGGSATFCTSTGTWFTGFTTPLSGGLSACSNLWSLSGCCCWAWRYTRYNASFWTTKIATHGRVFWGRNSRWFKLPATLLEFSGGLLREVSWTGWSRLVNQDERRLTHLQQSINYRVGKKLPNLEQVPDSYLIPYV